MNNLFISIILSLILIHTCYGQDKVSLDSPLLILYLDSIFSDTYQPEWHLDVSFMDVYKRMKVKIKYIAKDTNYTYAITRDTYHNGVSTRTILTTCGEHKWDRMILPKKCDSIMVEIRIPGRYHWAETIKKWCTIQVARKDVANNFEYKSINVPITHHIRSDLLTDKKLQLLDTLISVDLSFHVWNTDTTVFDLSSKMINGNGKQLLPLEFINNLKALKLEILKNSGELKKGYFYTVNPSTGKQIPYTKGASLVEKYYVQLPNKQQQLLIDLTVQQTLDLRHWFGFPAKKMQATISKSILLKW